MGRLRIAVDARDLTRDRRGIGTYVRALLTNFARRDDLELTLLVRDWFPRRVAPELRSAIGAAGRPAGCANRVPRTADVVWHPWNGTFFDSLRPAVATIHDIVPFALPAADEARRRSQQEPFRRTASTARVIVCDSAFTAAGVGRYLDVAPNRLRIVPLGVDPRFAPGDLAALPAVLRGRPYVLYVGDHDAHKNVPALVTAHRAAFPAGDVALAFTRPNPLAPEALVFEQVDLTTLVALYRAATIVAVPSLHEGFGLPLLEALACGAPALAARAASLPEVGADVAAYVDDPRDPAAWARALRALRLDGAARARMAARGPIHAAAFSWESCARRTLDILREVARSA
jgi:glycosyltransferase involved in cell wall biosynthesis